MEEVEPHPEAAFRIGMLRDAPEARRARRDAQFLGEFAGKRLCRAFPGFELAAGQLPESGQRLAFRPSRRQQAPLAPEDARGHVHHRQRIVPGIRGRGGGCARVRVHASPAP